MCSMQVLFRLGGLRWDTLCTLCFIFMTEKENNFQTDQNIALLHLKSKEKSLIYLNSHRYFLFYCLYYLNISRQKLNAYWCLPMQQLFGLGMRHTTHLLIWENAMQRENRKEKRVCIVTQFCRDCVTTQVNVSELRRRLTVW